MMGDIAGNKRSESVVRNDAGDTWDPSVALTMINHIAVADHG
jgi:hypothetical protein